MLFSAVPVLSPLNLESPFLLLGYVVEKIHYVEGKTSSRSRLLRSKMNNMKVSKLSSIFIS